jgi:hypothetical protein
MIVIENQMQVLYSPTKKSVQKLLKGQIDLKAGFEMGSIYQTDMITNRINRNPMPFTGYPA